MKMFWVGICSILLFGTAIPSISTAQSTAQSSAQSSAQSTAHSTRPNLLVLLCDDLGYGDLQCFGHPAIQTPNLDRMAAEGIRFTNAYAASVVCSPSRVGSMTGRNPVRAGIYDWIPEAKQTNQATNSRHLVHMRRDEVTIPQLLKSAGYATAMHVWPDQENPNATAK